MSNSQFLRFCLGLVCGFLRTISVLAPRPKASKAAPRHQPPPPPTFAQNKIGIGIKGTTRNTHKNLGDLLNAISALTPKHFHVTAAFCQQHCHEVTGLADEPNSPSKLARERATSADGLSKKQKGTMKGHGIAHRQVYTQKEGG